MAQPPTNAPQQPWLFDDLALETPEASFLLGQLEVFNWGPFCGLHRATFDPAGTAIIGPTGSGKTTLVDALMTLLVPQPRYNLASTGGHESDRTLISYVRGVLGGDGSDGREEVSRPGKTITGICATYQATSQVVRLAALMWTEGVGNTADDLKRRWIFSLNNDHTLESWLRLLHDEGVRELQRLSRETANLRIFDSKKTYLTHVRKFFQVGDNAFTLLNRAAGLKQLNSIDEIFRELVLDDRSAFDRATEVAGEFDNLAAIHAELEIAKRQHESLLPVASEHKKLADTQQKVQLHETLRRILPIWFAMESQKRWHAFLEEIDRDHESTRTQLLQQQKQAAECRDHVDSLHQRYLGLGGSVVAELEKTIEMQRERVRERSASAADYARMTRQFGLSDEISHEALLRNQSHIAATQDQVRTERAQHLEQTLSVLSQKRDQETSQKTIQESLRKVQERPGSNIDPRFQDFRSDLAVAVAATDGDLPFLAELIEVKSDQVAWRGAIERAIGSERLRILVPESKIDAALRWVNQRDNRIHVRLLRAKLDERPADFWDDGYLRKLNFKEHPLIASAKKLLAGRDLHCVASPEQLRHRDHSLTMEGMISGVEGRFEKQDQRKLNENWMTGFDNKDQLEGLGRQLQLAKSTILELQAESNQLQNQLNNIDQRLVMMEQLLKLEFATIDVPAAQADLNRSEERLFALLDPNSDTSQARSAYESERKRLESIQNAIRGSENKIAELNTKWKFGDEQRRKAAVRIQGGLQADETSLAGKHLPISPQIEAQDMADAEREMRDRIDKSLSEHSQRAVDIQQRLIRAMENAQRVDTGALTAIGTEIEDVPHYLERLRVLTEEALPEKSSRFLDYLNRSSDQGVTQLLASIDEEVDAIEQRIDELNQTLVKVDFRSGRYLQLQPQRMKEERLRTLDGAMRKVRSAALRDDGGESHFRALQEMVTILKEASDNRRQLGSKALLDPRFRLQFFVVEVDRQTGDRSPPRTGSQSGSGGEKELMASHILTASLSYALCPPAASRPVYATVVLDEAFSKSSPSAACRIIEALRIFCLHPIFVTPNKEIGLLKQHTRKVICVQRPKKEASLASITWESLEELARRP